MLTSANQFIQNETVQNLDNHVLTLRRLERVFRCWSVCETMEDAKKRYLKVWETISLLATLLLGYTVRVLVTSYQLPWQHTQSTKMSTKFQFLYII